MRKIQILCMAILAVLALGAVVVSSASAAEWETGGKGVKEGEVPTANSHGALVLHHEGGTFGNTEIECTGLFDGTVGPNGTDLIRLALSLSGSSTENDLIKCTNIKAPCEGGGPTVHVENLPWETQLLVVGTTVFDDFMEDKAPNNKGEPAYDVLCKVLLQEVLLLCSGLVKAKWDGNLTNGALFLWEKANTLSASCSDGGTAWITTGKVTNEVLGYGIK
jgi:hypothetical protein